MGPIANLRSPNQFAKDLHDINKCILNQIGGLICNPMGFHFYVDGLGSNVVHARAFGESVNSMHTYRFTLLYIFANE